MTPRIPSPGPALALASQACAKDLRSHSFSGNFDAFWDTWRQYLDRHGKQDPHARLAMRHVSSVSTGLLGYQSMSTDRQELAVQTRARWEAWMQVLPFDHQLNMVLDEYSPRRVHEIDFAWLKWHEWHALTQGGNPNEAFCRSSMGGWHTNEKPGPGSPRIPATVNEDLEVVERDVAMTPQGFQGHQQTKLRMMWAKLLSSKAWERADEWLGISGFDVNSTMGNAWAHHETSFSYGATMVALASEQPGWLSAVFAGASEPGLWEHLARAGGPASAREALARIDGGLDNILELSKPSVSLTEETSSRLLETAAQWQAQAMDAALDTPVAAPRVRRF